MRLPLLIVVTGMPSSGKTTVADGLASQLRLPMIAKDEIKESLYDSLGPGYVKSSALLGGAAYALIFARSRASSTEKGAPRESGSSRRWSWRNRS